MPDTKTGRERKGLDKRAQLERRIARRDARAMVADDEAPFAEPPRPSGGADAAEEDPGERLPGRRS
jgi:hypothetical protein